MSRLWLNRNGTNIAGRLKSWLTRKPGSPACISLVAGYVSVRGLMLIESDVRRALDRGTEVRLLLAVTQDEAIWIRLPDPFTDVADVLRRRLARDVEYLRTELSGIPMVREAQVRLLGLAHLLRRQGFSCRRHESAFVHSKVFVQHGSGLNPAAVIGSANLTLGGLMRNEECGIQTTGAEAQQAVEYATALWNEAVPFDLAGLLEEQFANYPHELVFLRILFEVFGGDVNAEDKLSLAPWQRDGVARALVIAQEYGGALIADDVGVGKTFEAAEIIRRGIYERGERVVVICPANLVPMWERRLAGWNLPADVVSYHSLSRAVQDAMQAGSALPYQLVVLDEAHWLRNPTTWRDALREALASADNPPRVFGLTATPIQNRGQDLVEIVMLLLPKLSVQERRALAERCRRADRLKPEQLHTLHRQLESMLVRRTRPFIKENYPKGMGDASLAFPEQVPKEVRYRLPSRLRTLIRDVLAALDVENADLPQAALTDYHDLAPNETPPPALTMAAYHLQDYKLNGGGGSEVSSFDWTRLIKCMLCKRLESSVAALASTLEAMRSRCAKVLQDLDSGLVYLPAPHHTDREQQQDWWGGMLDGQNLVGPETDETVARQPRTKLVAHSASLFAVSQIREDVGRDIATLTALRDSANDLISVDPKVPVLVDQIARIAAHPDGPKVVIFTGSRVTGEHITNEIMRHVASDPRLALYRNRIASLARLDRPTERQIREITADFAPQAADIAPGAFTCRAPRNRYDLLICTDMLAEGINLQQTAFVIHFDLPWNPMMIGQRAGRADRLGSPYEQISCLSVFPDRGLDAQLHLLNRLYGKINLAAAAVGVPTPIIPGAAVQVRDFTTTVRPQESTADTFPAFDSDVYRAALGTAMRTPGLGDAIRNFPRKAGGVVGNGEVYGFVFCFRINMEPRNKAALCTIFTNGASLVDQSSCLHEARVEDLRSWLKDAASDHANMVKPAGALPGEVLQRLWPALEQARKRVAVLHKIADSESDDQITVITWLALAKPIRQG
ncbi:SNF2-related protein [Saccharopolyspora hirsuta]|nr:SNF2-related protein [Saccharopolyspora hirsuta]